MTKRTQKSNQVAFLVPPNAKDYTLTDTEVENGGILRANQGAQSITLLRVASTGTAKGSGVYGVVLATKPVKNFLWDNTGLDHEIVSGDEAAMRIMGRAGTCKINNVNFRCRKWKNPKNGRVDWWKQGVQIRDADSVTFTGGRIIGPIDVGQQKNTARTPQRVGTLTFNGVAMTHMPSITDKKTVGKIFVKNCRKIGEDGKVKGKWPDTTF